jgi:hypothetical protein
LPRGQVRSNRTGVAVRVVVVGGAPVAGVNAGDELCGSELRRVCERALRCGFAREKTPIRTGGCSGDEPSRSEAKWLTETAERRGAAEVRTRPCGELLYDGRTS